MDSSIPTRIGATPDDVDASADAETRARLSAAIGEQYHLGHLLGAGGFAQVYSAWDARLQRRVAVKVLHESLRADPGIRARFQREAQVVASLRHPHIVPIYAVGESHGLAFFVMPQLEGQSLADAIDRGVRWSLPDVCRILRECAGALAEAHREGLVHRDVKPDNIFLEGPERRVVLMDFGIAKQMDAAASEMTSTGMVIGSPQYMSPEQAVGDAVDQFSDQYSLALVGHRMLTGRPAFEADSVRALLYKQANETPAPVETVRPDTPSSLAAILVRALAKERRARFASMGEMEAALTRVAGEVAGDFRRQRVAPALSDQWTAALTRLYQGSWIAPLVAVIALVVFVVIYPGTEAPGARVALGARDAALTRARQFLHDSGAPDLPIERAGLEWNGALYEYLQRTGERQTLAMADRSALIWVWDLYRGSSPSPDTLRIGVRPGGVLAWYTRQDDGALGRGDLGEETGRRQSELVLVNAGITLDELGPPQHTAATSSTRTDHTFVWTSPPAAGAAGLARVVRATWSGPSLTNVIDGRRAPPDSVEPAAGSNANVYAALAGVGVLALGFTALSIAVRRARFDTVQWTIGLRLALVFFVVQLVSVILPALPTYLTTMSIGAMLADVIAIVPPMTVRPDTVAPFLMLVVGLAAAESLTYERRPDLIAGVERVSRGRLLVPEMVRVVPAGYAAGLALVALQTLARAALQRWGGVPISAMPALTPEAINTGAGVLGLFSEVRYMAMDFACAAVLVGLGLRSGRAWLGSLAFIPLAFVLDVNFGKPLGSLAAFTVVDALLLGVWSLVLGRQGWLAAMLALWIFRVVPVTADLVWAGGAYRSAIPQALLVIATPLAIAIVTYVRRPRAPREKEGMDRAPAGSDNTTIAVTSRT